MSVFAVQRVNRTSKGGPSGTGNLLTRKGQELLSAYEQFENAAKENMEKRHDTYLRLVIRSSGTRNG